MRTPRFLSVAALAVLLSALAGGFFGSSAQVTQDQVAQQYRVFTAALDAVDREYAEPLASDRLIYDAVGGMLQTLDPHSSFFDPRSYAQMRERQEGKYYGIGLSIQAIDGDITVMSLFEGSPAYRAGIRRGDVIARVKGEDAKNWTTEQTARQLKGPKGTKVNISIRRPGYDKLIEMEVERDEVNIVTVRGAFMLDGQTGYIKLGDFSETSDKEVGDALEKLKGQGMKRLVFDLRDNPGGPLDQAIKIANRFLPRGDMIVYTRGRVQNADQDYRGTDEPDFTGPLMVLVNRQSASASEIVSGAIQDHDRGLVVGETTFGKALVQSVYRISEGAGLALTTGRYFTPSGRMIQRPWDNAFDEYLTYSLREQTEKREHNPAQLKYTDAGRKVYSGGGIEPDKFFVGPVQGYNPTRFGRSLVARAAFANFAERFYAEGDTRMSAASEGRTRLARGFTITDTMLSEFKSFLQTEQKLKIDDAAFARDLDFIKAMMHFEIDVALFGIGEAQKNLIAKDPQAQFALTQFGEAVKLTELARNRTASKGGN
ncbi:MAG TPA: S41 family peptidase [Vicinamibacterales bacterium]|nr:S41 family peptidase [Vicinamibacterales bacterium]